MKTHCSNQRNQAMTLFEVVIVIIVVIILVMTLIPASPHRSPSQKISCINCLKQLGLAYKIWAGDNNDKCPMEISVTNGGAMEWMNTPDAWKVYQVMSNELSTPKIIYCPADTRAGPATNFTTDLKNKISYFVGWDASDTNPAALLSGDDNFLLNQSPVPAGLVSISSSAPLKWNLTRHVSEINDGPLFKIKTGTGNILLCDGSVMAANNSGLTNQLQQTGFATNRLVIP
jgi:hypothetical protein